MSMDHNHPGGFSGTVGAGGSGHIAWSASSGTPKKKTLTYNSIEVSYDYETKQLKVVNAGGEEINYDEEELAELRNALTALGLSIPPGSGVTCR